jgi:hypothetical protein
MYQQNRQKDGTMTVLSPPAENSTGHPTKIATNSSGTSALIASVSRSNALHSYPVLIIIERYINEIRLDTGVLGDEISLSLKIQSFLLSHKVQQTHTNKKNRKLFFDTLRYTHPV